MNRWLRTWRYVQDCCAKAYFDLAVGEDWEAWKPEPAAPLKRTALRVLLAVELLGERMEALAFVLEQRAPVDANSHRHSLEDVGRLVYTAKAAVAILLDRRGDVESLAGDPVCVAIYNVRRDSSESSNDESWDEVIVPEGFGDWRFQIRSESSY